MLPTHRCYKSMEDKCCCKQVVTCVYFTSPQSVTWATSADTSQRNAVRHVRVFQPTYKNSNISAKLSRGVVSDSWAFWSLWLAEVFWTRDCILARLSTAVTDLVRIYTMSGEGHRLRNIIRTRRGRPRRSWLGNVSTWTGLSLEE